MNRTLTSSYQRVKGEINILKIKYIKTEVNSLFIDFAENPTMNDNQITIRDYTKNVMLIAKYLYCSCHSCKLQCCFLKG